MIKLILLLLIVIFVIKCFFDIIYTIYRCLFSFKVYNKFLYVLPNKLHILILFVVSFFIIIAYIKRF